MAKNTVQINLLKIWEILERFSDENNPLSTQEIIKRLSEADIKCDRRTIGKDIRILQENGYEIASIRMGHSYGYYVLNREFDIPELRILIDAVQAAKFISEKKTRALIEKIANLAGKYRGEILRKNIVCYNQTKHANEAVYYNVDVIEEGILRGKQVSFRYFDYDAAHRRVYRKNGKRYVVNPVSTMFSDDNYYIVCYTDEHNDSLGNYRIDRMSEVEMEQKAVIFAPKIKEIDLSEYRKQAFQMFVGEKEKVIFEADSSLIDIIVDKFGEKLILTESKAGKVRFEAEVQVSPTFYAWCCAFGRRLKVLGPASIRAGIKVYISELENAYKE